MNTDAIQITAEVTPNPNTLKFNVNKMLVESGSLNFPDRGKAKGSLLPERLFQINEVIGVMVGRDFITVTKAPAAEWQALAQPVMDAISWVMNSGERPFSQAVSLAPARPPDGQASPASGSADAEIERKVRDILDHEIRPAVAMDGGDITFHGYADGVVTLHLQGSCSSCPSSILTLKMGVENRLKSMVPEIREVIQV